jgi:hypothetical protein
VPARSLQVVTGIDGASAAVTLVGGSKIELWLWDYDPLDDNDSIMGCRYEAIDAATIRGGDLGCRGDGGVFIEATISAR